ncbi:MAG: S8 family peptidase [Cellulosilyticaceae bacterium]
MRQEKDMREYIVPIDIDAAGFVEKFSKKYPSIVIRPIAESIYVIEVPVDDIALINNIDQSIGGIIIPAVYGLSANEALQASNILTFHNYPFGELRGKGTLVALIDTGIDYTNKIFQYEDNTTRIVSLWDQNIEGNSPYNFQFGTQYTEEQINTALKSPAPYSVVPSKDEIGHGTFLAGVAAGKDRSAGGSYTGAAPDCNLVIVKLRQISQELRAQYFIPNGVPAYAETNIIAGVSYAIQEATRVKKSVAILIGLGNNFGDHGGSTILEKYLSSLTTYPGIVVVVAAGNEGNAGSHYQGNITTGGKVDIEVNIAEKEEGLNIGLWTRDADKVSISLVTPIGQIVERVPLQVNKEQKFKFTLQESIVTISYSYPNVTTGGELAVISLEKPIPGRWTISIYGDYIINGIFNMWLPRIGFINSNTRFTEPNSSTTVSIPGTATDVIVVGAYDYIDGSIYAASGRGPTTTAAIRPDLVAPGVNVEGPSLAGGYTIYVGTSTAAAITVGACALLLEWAIVKGNLPTLNTRIARVILIRGASRQRGVSYPNNIEGYGKLDLENSFALL